MGGLYPRGQMIKDKKERERLHLAEIKHGRLAMIAITLFAASEFIAHAPVIDQYPLFFKPFWEVLFEGPPEYYIPPEVVTERAAELTSAATETVSSATMEATTVAPELAAPAVSEAVAAAPAAATEVATTVQPPAGIEALSASSMDAISPSQAAPSAAEELAAVKKELAAAEELVTAKEELAAAKIRIVELEDKLNQINV